MFTVTIVGKSKLYRLNEWDDMVGQKRVYKQGLWANWNVHQQ